MRQRDLTFKVMSMAYNADGAVPTEAKIVAAHKPSPFDPVAYLDTVAKKLEGEGMADAANQLAEGFTFYADALEERKAEAARAKAAAEAKKAAAKKNASKAKTEEVAADASESASEVDDLAASLQALSKDEMAALLKKAFA